MEWIAVNQTHSHSPFYCKVEARNGMGNWRTRIAFHTCSWAPMVLMCAGSSRATLAWRLSTADWDKRHMTSGDYHVTVM